MGLGAPWWEPDARGTITGLTRGAGTAHFARAALEAMAYGTADVMEAMVAASGQRFKTLRVDGGASANDWLLQFQADMLRVPVERPSNIETTAMGAAGLAGIAAGVWADAESFMSAQDVTAFPPQKRTDVAALRAGWSRAVDATLGIARAGKQK